MSQNQANKQSMRGKVCMVTGATSGIGQVTAAALAAQGAHVIVVGRNRAKAQQVVGEIRRQTGNDAVWYLLADFSDLQQVRELAAAFSAQYSQLDVLVNNAGTYFNTRHPAPGGVEMTFHVNHLAHFLLTNLLLDTLTASAPARIVNVTSRAHEYDNMDFDDLGFERSYFGMKAYARSKLANLLFTYELARRLAGSGVTVNAVHPGGVATDIWRTNFPVLGPAIKWVMSLFALTPEEGADTLIYLAS
ncbi:MAG: SDR family NAD(P)-dependent oxidoreductase, partial [Anaerolineae bacterium]|nr:SDR family NAD(P)-dependent oxidoreductase [Anaerolineae bacterium]